MADDVQRSLGRIEGTLATMQKDGETRDRQLDLIIADIEKRTRWLERKINWAGGLFTAGYAFVLYRLKTMQTS